MLWTSPQVCVWVVWVCFRVKFSFATLTGYSPCQTNSVIPRSQTQVKSAVLLKETRYKLKAQTEKWGRNCLGGYIITEVLASSPRQALTTWLLFRKCKWHIALLCDISKPTCSVLALDSVDPALGRSREGVKQASFSSLTLYSVFYPGWNPSGLFKHVTQFALNSWDKGLHAAQESAHCSHTVKWCQKVATILC